MNVLIAIDGGEAAKMVLQEAKKFLCNITNPKIHVFNVMEISSIAMGQGYDSTLLTESMQLQADELKKVAVDILGDIPFDFATQTGYASEEILKMVNSLHCDLLIMGTHGRTGLDHLLVGSVAEKTLRLANCNTLVIPVKK